ncbi:MAG: Rieske 2Fe-2S domain-containing protein [bacterium]|nr:Rieske 2Fe-2S domain-containing protein [bacterium]
MFGKRGVLVPGADKLQEGEARKVDVHALDSSCPHEDGRIVPGPLVEGHQAVCPLHNYHFDVRTGKAVGVACRAGPHRCRGYRRVA